MASLTGLEVIIIEWVLLGFCLILVCIRVHTRLSVRRAIWSWADFFVIMAWIFTATQCGMDTRLLVLGFFDPKYDSFNPSELEQVEVLKIFYVENASYRLILYMIKFSMLCFYRPFFMPSLNLRKTYIAYWITIVFTVVGCVVSNLLNFLACVPISRNWTLDPDRLCTSAYGDGYPLYIAYVFHLGSDLMIWLLPIPIVRTLNLSPKKKWQVGIMFGLGFLCVFFALNVILTSWYPASYSLIWLFCAMEQTWAITVACAPFLRTFWRVVLKALVSERDPNNTTISGVWEKYRGSLSFNSSSNNRDQSERRRTDAGVVNVNDIDMVEKILPIVEERRGTI